MFCGNNLPLNRQELIILILRSSRTTEKSLYLNSFPTYNALDVSVSHPVAMVTGLHVLSEVRATAEETADHAICCL